MPRLPRLSRTLALIAVVALGLAPYVRYVELRPMTADAVLWIARGAPVDPDWREWVFASRHFNVGYRPVAAFSYTLDWWIGGYAPLVYRVTDLALHAGACLLLAGLARRLGCSPWAAILAAALFAVHPATAEVVPFLARRGYSLATCFGLAALWLQLVALAPARSARVRAAAAVGAGIGLACALLCNEASILLYPVAAAITWARLRAPASRAARANRAAAFLRAALVPGLLLAATLGLRTWVVGGLGGYRVEEAAGTRLPDVLVAMLRTLGGLEERGSSPAWATIAACAGAWLLASAAFVREGPARLALGWLLGYAVLYPTQLVWFPRQGYLALVPLSLLIAAVVQRACARFRGRPGALALHLAPALSIAAIWVAHSPLARFDAPRHRRWLEHDALLATIQEGLEGIEPPAQAYLVLPARDANGPRELGKSEGGGPVGRNARQPFQWARLIGQERGVAVDELVYFEGETPPTLSGGGRSVRIPPGRGYVRRTARRLQREGPEARREVPVPTEGGRLTHVFLWSPSGGEWVRIAPRAPD